jgi:hypothetical protein
VFRIGGCCRIAANTIIYTKNVNIMRNNRKNAPLTWDELGEYYKDPYIAKAEYLISRGYTGDYAGDYAVYTLAEIVYNKAMLIKENSDNHGDLAK